MAMFSNPLRVPIPFDSDLGRDVAALYAGWDGDEKDLVAGTAGCSPYLAGLLRKEASWLQDRRGEGLQTLVDALIADLGRIPADRIKPDLRRAKGRIALLSALADLGGFWRLEQVTGALTRFADAAVHQALLRLVEAELRRGKLPGMGMDDAGTAAGMVVLAMGKMGAFELNYSSDIDLICLFDPERFGDDVARVAEARGRFVRITRNLAQILSDNTADGYVFRTDLRLRPDPSVTPVCLSTEAAERYYESVGRTWERAAFIKARAAAGDLAAGEAFLGRLRPFVWRKHLDFVAIQDAHDMRLRIREHKGLARRAPLEDYDLKLGAGGIREIEFFTQTRQIIAGGRDSDLRVRGTVPGLAVLADKGWVPQDVAQTLTDHYRAHREVEHRLQMINDAQTHRLPVAAAGFDRLARFMGEGDTDTLRRRLRARLDRVAEVMEPFFAGREGAQPVSYTHLTLPTIYSV